MIELNKLGIGSRRSLFKCAYCDSKVMRQTNNGRKQKSCGCIMENLLKKGLGRIHSGKGTRLYNIWKGMKVRCYTKTHHSYIKVCERWKKDFVAFREWSMQMGYKNNLTIDRINKQKDYSPDNCQWITRKENSRKDKIKYNNQQIQKARWLYFCCKWKISKISNSLVVNRLAIYKIIRYQYLLPLRGYNT